MMRKTQGYRLATFLIISLLATSLFWIMCLYEPVETSFYNSNRKNLELILLKM